ncbi:hypothetical protein [Mariprofundus ferrooxydans]|uniref:Uncharacterized protein n=1 Tax=Mariprofundus ferrooxydans PV-1 TaxID=314345 RepID=Q0F3P9_9PROT|nr:hypothetical protein [Mariprofundus ferrooxydans]EAU55892.1 hypothetical protein SPV1_03708 [Mariprofundus ferrooxydans PV-1]KON48171.1 hypothetical protein AL013_03820 [Mariprofundus ferrooxydans]
MKTMRWMAATAMMIPTSALADPLDTGEAYTTRQTPPEWMDNVDLSLLLVDYAIFALMLVGFGWLLFKRPHYFLKLEAILKAPFKAIFAAGKRAGGVTEFILQMVGGIAVFLSLAAWVFFCQWLKSKGLGAFSMIGLALMALMLVRLIKGDEKPRPVS